MADEQSLSGVLLPTTPSLAFEATTKQYVDLAVAKTITTTYLIANATRTSTQTLTATSLALTNLATGQYALQGTLFYTGASAGDIALSFTPTNLQTSNGSYWSIFGLTSAATAATGATYDVTGRAFTGSIILGCIASTVTTATVSGGFYVSGATGGFTLNMAQGASSTTATTLLGGSWLTATYLGV